MNNALKVLVNIAAVIAAQAGVAVNCEGGFGLAKGEFWRGVARAMGYKFFCWVLDETKVKSVGEVAPDQWVPWNHHAHLQLVH